jgi:V8-like Glu-specific endopeptidase
MKRVILVFSFLVNSSIAFSATYAVPESIGLTQTKTLPYSLIGQLNFANGRSHYIGSATVIRPSSALTAAHNLWDNTNGFSTDILFRRALSGSTFLSSQYASRLYVLAGYREGVRQYQTADPRTFASDTGGLVFRNALAGGASIGWSSNPNLLNGSNPVQCLGYGGETHTGNDLLSATSTAPFKPVFGAFWSNLSLLCEPGMSGGPALARTSDGKFYLTGVVVAGSSTPVSTGIRILDPASIDFIQRYLK